MLMMYRISLAVSRLRFRSRLISHLHKVALALACRNIKLHYFYFSLLFTVISDLIYLREVSECSCHLKKLQLSC